MDVSDIATKYEEIEREAQISVARHRTIPAIDRRRKLLADAQAIAAQRGPDDPELQALNMECTNECGEPLSLQSDDVFCCKECAEDWEARERAARYAGKRQ